MTAATTPIDDGGARHLVAGLPMPAVELPATTGGGVNLAHIAGRAVLFVYPWTGRPGVPNPPAWDDIPGAHGSTPEAQRFAALQPAFERLRVRVYGISGQDTDWQREFAGRLALPFPLLSDAEGRLRAALRLPTFETGGVVYLRRLTLVVENAAVACCFYPVHPPETHADEVLAWLGRGR